MWLGPVKPLLIRRVVRINEDEEDGVENAQGRAARGCCLGPFGNPGRISRVHLLSRDLLF